MTKTWFYHYTGGYCGTDEYGLVQAETEGEASESMYPEALAYAEQWAYDPRGGGIEDEDELEVEIEDDLSITLYDPITHNAYLNGDETGYIEHLWFQAKNGLRYAGYLVEGGVMTENGVIPKDSVEIIY